MAIKELLQSIASKLPEDQAEIKSLIAGAIREADSILDDLKSANAESKSRKEKIRELQAQIDGTGDFTEKEKALNAEIKRLKEIEAEHLAAKAIADKQVIDTWTEKSKVFGVDKTHKQYEKLTKLKEHFAFPTEGQEITVDMARANLDKYETLETAGVFEISTDIKDSLGNPPKPNTGNDGVPLTSGDALLRLTKK